MFFVNWLRWSSRHATIPSAKRTILTAVVVVVVVVVDDFAVVVVVVFTVLTLIHLPNVASVAVINLHRSNIPDNCMGVG